MQDKTTHTLLKNQRQLVPCFYSNERGTTPYRERASLTARIICSAQEWTGSTPHTAHCPTVSMSHIKEGDFGLSSQIKTTIVLLKQNRETERKTLEVVVSSRS